MNLTCEEILRIRPRLIHRACGGWLAMSEEGSPLRIGVEGHSEEEARRRFEAAVERWRLVCEVEKEESSPVFV